MCGKRPRSSPQTVTEHSYQAEVWAKAERGEHTLPPSSGILGTFPLTLGLPLSVSPSLFIFYLLFNAWFPGGIGKITGYCLGTPACDSVHAWAHSPPAASFPLAQPLDQCTMPPLRLWKSSQASLPPGASAPTHGRQTLSAWIRDGHCPSLQCRGAPACSRHLSVPIPVSLRVLRMAVVARWELGRKRTGGACSLSPKPTPERILPRSGRAPEVGNGNPLQYACLENSTDRGAW